jgi:hypothetical protein
MANKSYAITMSLLRIGVLAGQIAVSPSAAAQSTPRHHDGFLASERTCAFADLAVRPILIGPMSALGSQADITPSLGNVRFTSEKRTQP